MRSLVVIGSGDFRAALDAPPPADAPRLEFVEIARAIGAAFHSFNPPAGTPARVAALLKRRAPIASGIGAALVAGSYDAIYVTGEDIGLPLALLLKLRGWRGRLVCLAHNLTPARIARFRRIGPGIFAKVITVSRAQAAILTDQCGFPAEKVASVYNWVDERFFDPAAAAPVEGTYFIACGAENRDYATLSKAFEQVTDTPIRVFGHGFWKTGDADARTPAPGAVVQMPRVSYAELRDQYAGAQCAIVPINPVAYAAGVTGLLEAMSSGLPVMISDTPGMAEYLDPIDPALRLPPADAGAIAAAVRALDRSPEALAATGRRNRAWILAHSRLDDYVDYIAKLMRGAEDRGSPVLAKARAH